MFNLSSKNIFLLGFIAVLLVAIPFTVYLVQREQRVRSHAAPTTTLSFNPSSPPPVTVNSTVSLDLYLDPGTNVVSFLNLSLRYDPKYLSQPTFTPSPDSLLIPVGSVTPVINETSGIFQETFAVAGTAATSGTSGVTNKIKLGTFQFTAIATTSAGTPTQVIFDGTKAYSTNPTDPSSQNVFVIGSSTPASVVIVSASSASPTPTSTPAPSSAPSPTAAGQGPVCQSLVSDRTASGTAPFDITLTATGSDSNANITKATFNFGDGPTQDVTQAGGIGTNSVSVQVAHAYQNPGSYTASVIFTDSNNAVSSIGTCSLPITVYAASSGSSGSAGGTSGTISTGTESAQATPTQIAEVTQIPTVSRTLPVTGPSVKIIGAGLAGAILSILGATLFFGL
ncbi:PKD domain-containing protein [Patescibacteria group bacterium]|nr:PKD domain-containing protein [Patescibacteria group bacterium]MCL5010051.1 PKD domain-containing protein [Patescibacteria group bacterium]